MGIKHNQIKHQAEMKLKKSKPFLTTVTRVTDKTELSDEVDKVYPTLNIEQIKAEFKRPEANKNPKREYGRDDISHSDIPITIMDNENIFDDLPSTSRNIHKYIQLGLEGYPYYEHFKPSFKPTLYKKKQGKKFVGPRGTWMFDLMYFSDYNTKKHRKQVIYP